MKSQFKIKIKLDFWTIGLALILSIIGILFIFSSSSHLTDNTKYIKQIASLALSLIVYFVVANFNYQKYESKYTLVYLIGIFLLILTLIFGSEINGNKSWIKLGFFNIQLSEFCKITFLIFFAVFLHNSQNTVKNASFILVSLVLLLPYLGLIILQPDIGTSLIFIFIFFVMLIVGGASRTYLAVLAGAGLMAVLIPFSTHYIVHSLKIENFILTLLDSSLNLILMGLASLGIAAFFFFLFRFFGISKKIFVLFLVFFTLSCGFLTASAVKKVLKNHHYKRFLVFINPELDPTGHGYNTNQSKISIGSGRFSGHGLAKGTQNLGQFLPSEDTDFIVALIGEEWGFVGVVLILVLFVLLIYRGLYIAYSARDYIGSMIALGITAMYMGHITINIFSVTGLFPVVGVPLPFISYGGSSLLANFIGLGILFNIKMRRFAYN